MIRLNKLVVRRLSCSIICCHKITNSSDRKQSARIDTGILVHYSLAGIFFRVHLCVSRALLDADFDPVHPKYFPQIASVWSKHGFFVRCQIFGPLLPFLFYCDAKLPLLSSISLFLTTEHLYEPYIDFILAPFSNICPSTALFKYRKVPFSNICPSTEIP